MAIFNTVYGGEPKWKPGSNTLIYYKFDGNLNDSSGNSRNGTAGGTITYGTNYVDLTNGYVTVPNITYKNDTTVSMRFKLNNAVVSGNTGILAVRNGGCIFQIQTYDTSPYSFGAYSDKPSYSLQNLGNLDTNWHLFTMVADRSGLKYYFDGELKGTKSAWNSTYNPNGSKIGTGYNGTSHNNLQQYTGEFIIESKSRTADEILLYYNRTKTNYS